MDIKLYAVLDTKTQRFMVPWYLHSDVEATRHFTNLVNQDNSQISLNPNDYELYALGVWNDETGETVPINIHVVSASACVNRPELSTNQLEQMMLDIAEIKSEIKRK